MTVTCVIPRTEPTCTLVAVMEAKPVLNPVAVADRLVAFDNERFVETDQVIAALGICTPAESKTVAVTVMG